MIARSVRILAATVLLLVGLTIVAGAVIWHWLLHTDAGAAWLWESARAAAPGELSAVAFEGTLTGGFELSNLSYAGESLSVKASRVRLAIHADLLPPSLDVENVQVTDVLMRQLERPEPRRAERGGRFSPANLALPFKVALGKLVLERLRILSPDGAAIVTVDRAEIAGRWDESIVLSRLDVASSADAVQGSAKLSLQKPFEASASLEVTYPLQVGTDTVPLAFAAAASGTLADLAVRITGHEPDITIEGRLLDLLDAPAWDLAARSPGLQWPPGNVKPALSLRELAVASHGKPSRYALEANGIVTVAAGGALRFSLEGAGDPGGIEVQRLRLDGPMLTAESRGGVSWSNGFAVRLDADVARFDPAVLSDAWPAGLPVSGRASAAFSPGRLKLEAVHARILETDQGLDAQGLLDLEAGVIDLGLDWRNLRWPLAGDEWRIRSEFGEMTLTGEPDDWALAGRIGLQAPDLPAGTFELSGSGNREEAALELEDSRVLGGNLAGQVHYNWREEGRWSADLTAAGVNTGTLFAAWPGRLSGRFTASGRLQPFEMSVDIGRLSGSLRDRPLHGAGGICWAGGDLVVRNLTLVSGQARLEANGSLRARDGFEFAIDVPALGALVPEAAGSLRASGQASLAGDFPRLEMNLEGRKLAWRDWRLEALTVTGREGAEPLMIGVDGWGLDLGGLRTGAVHADFAGGADRQALEIEASLDERRVALALEGRVGDWRRPLASGWTGRLQALELVLNDRMRFELEEPAGLELDRDLVALERACLAGDGAARICLAGTRTGPADVNASAELSAMPVGLVKMLYATELEFTQTLGGTLRLRARPGRRMSADARIDITPGQIHNPGNPLMALRTRAGSFRLNLQDGRILFARLYLPAEEAAAVDAEVSLADVRRGAESEIDGRIGVDVHDIGVPAALLPAIDRAGGRLKAELALAGTVADPTLTGDASLTGGSLVYAPLGLELADVELTGRIREGNRVELEGSFRAGKGTGRIYTSTNALGPAANRAWLRLTGDDLTIIDLPQVNVVAGMDLAFGLTPDRLTLNGNMRIPRARLSPRQITSARVSESEDVVIVAGENEEEEEAEQPSRLAIDGHVALGLGDDVVVNVGAAETRLRGSVLFDWDGPPMPMATGEYKVAGRFEAFGQLLEITEGSVRFPGIPANNPGLRIRAEREIFGNPRIRSAGVLVSGTARNPELEVYTNPATSRERALTMLVTGSDFSYEQGVGAVDVGTYIAPDLYLSYGIGLFDRENVVSLRYDFGRGFGIKASSGKTADGVDLSYTFQR